MIGQSLAAAANPPRLRAITAASVAAVEAALVWRFGWTAPLAAYLYFGAVLTVAAVADGRWWPLGRAVIAMAAIAAFYLAIALVAGGQQLGLADVTAGGLVGLLLGWVVALVAVVVWRPSRRPGRTAAIPVGPCLWLGALVAVLAAR